MKNRILIILILFSLTSSPAFSQWDYGFDFSKAGSAGLQFLKIGIGARESAMGEAALGITSGMNSIFWNPAGIANVEKRAVSFSQSKWLLDIDINAAAIGMNLGSSTVLGISAIYLGIPDFQETTVLMQDGTGRMVSANDLAVGLALARRFTDKLTIGGQVRYVEEKLDQDSFNNVLFDFGAIYDTGFRHLRISVCAQHFGPDIKMLRDKFRMPLIFKVGVADDLFNSENHRLTLAADLLHPTDNTERMNFGSEYGLNEWIFIRGGYRMNSDLGAWSFGAGLQQSFIGLFGALDYAYTDYGSIMGSVSRLSFTLGF